ncbi:MAG: NUDIX hydrolase [Planctomycetota bacterium]
MPIRPIAASPFPVTYAAFGYLRDEADRLLLVANRYESLGVLWGVPGGAMEPGETAEACVAREFEEEVGLRVRVRRDCGVIERVKPEWKIHLCARFFVVEALSGALQVHPDEEHVFDFRFLAPEEIRNWPEPVLGRGRILEFLREPHAQPRHVLMAPGEE